MSTLDVRPIAVVLNVIAYSLLAGVAALVMFGSSLMVNRPVQVAHPPRIERPAAATPQLAPDNGSTNSPSQSART